MGKTAPKAAIAESSFRIKCGDDGFHQGSLDVQHHSCAGDLHRARTCYFGDNFTNMLSVLKWLFGEMPHSNSR